MSFFDRIKLRKRTSGAKAGLVLSGGGSRGSFQLGALSYLYRRDDFAPEVFVGTSAGAMFASALAQYDSKEKQSETVDKISELWLGMQTQSDMFIERAWYNVLRTQGPEWMSMLGAVKNDDKDDSKKNNQDFSEDDKQKTKVDPLTLALSDEEEIENDWSPLQLVQMLPMVSKIGRVGSDLNAVWRGAEQTRSCYRPGPLLKDLLDPEIFLPSRTKESGNVLRVSMVSLESGELRYMREDGILVDDQDRPISDKSHSVAIGVLASCAIPAVFLPVPVGDETYIDGGARNSLPVEFSMKHLNTRPTYLVSAGPSEPDLVDSMAEADIISTVIRSTWIVMGEPLRDAVAYAKSTDAIQIEPEIAVHGYMEVDPGLCKINWDYGWIRAAEATNSVFAASAARHKKIIELRIAAHKLEQILAGEASNKDTKLKLAGVKLELRDELTLVNSQALPVDADQWWRNYEDHQQGPSIKPFWENIAV